LTFSRQTEQELKPVQVKAVTEEALKFLRASLPTSIDIHKDLRSDSLIMADPTQIHQVLMNLCANAGHAMKAKGGTLKVRLSDVELDPHFIVQHPGMVSGPHLQLTVSDTGQGITSETLERIFDPYFTTKDKDEGTGLGLSVVHGIIKSYKGTITVSSRPGKGSDFNVFLPVIEKEIRAEDADEVLLPTGNERILFIDDEPTLVEIGEQMLERLGYEVDTRRAGAEALDLFKSQPDRYDLVVTDMTMPGMSGDELAGKLLKIRKDIPIILCTGFSQRITETKAKHLGIRAFLMKPLIMRDLAATIRKVLDER
jgi:CheY-like chemotaxis protein